MSRHIVFEGVDNFRDFGGYAAGERQLKRGLLYRSAHHASATEADLQRLAGLGLSVIVDLRRPSERERQPSRRWTGCGVRVIESDVGQGEPGDWLSFVAAGDLSFEACRGYMLGFYRAIPFAPRYLDLYASYFAALAETDGAVVVHCAAGKDRTGVICALTHAMAGVAQHDIVEDYLLTNRSQRLEERLPAIAEAVEKAAGRRPSDAALRMMLGVSPEFLEAAFQAIRERHGSLEGYLSEALGLTPLRRAQIHDRLLG